MKITDVKVTVWKWDNIPPTQYTKDFKSLESRSTNMALVQILTDEDITGYAFLGNSMASIGYNAQIIVERFRPGLVGKDPLDRERIWQNLSKWSLGGTMLQIDPTVAPVQSVSQPPRTVQTMPFSKSSSPK